jgi:hypothetical protein
MEAINEFTAKYLGRNINFLDYHIKDTLRWSRFTDLSGNNFAEYGYCLYNKTLKDVLIYLIPGTIYKIKIKNSIKITNKKANFQYIIELSNDIVHFKWNTKTRRFEKL